MPQDDQEAQRTWAALEISDNLLQDIQGLLLRLHASCQTLESLLERADGVLSEARERIGALAPEIANRKPRQQP